jgi:hypothetical protein
MAKAQDTMKIVAINAPVPKGFIVTSVEPSTMIKTIAPEAPRVG